MDDAYHTLEVLSLKKGLNGLHTNGLNRNIATNGTANGKSNSDSDSQDGVSPRTETRHTNGFGEVFQKLTDKSVHARFDSLVSEIATRKETNGTTPPAADLEYQLLVYSARDETTLKRMLQQYSTYYNEHITGSLKTLQQLAHTLAKRRSRMTLRSFAVGNASISAEEIGLLGSECVRSSLETHLCFVFTGQGAQYARMGLELMQYPVFKSILSETNKIFQTLGADWSLFGMPFQSIFLPAVTNLESRQTRKRRRN